MTAGLRSTASLQWSCFFRKASRLKARRDTLSGATAGHRLKIMQAGKRSRRNPLFGDRSLVNEATARTYWAKWTRNHVPSTPMHISHHGERARVSHFAPPVYGAYRAEHTWSRFSRLFCCLSGTLLLMCVWVCYVDSLWATLNLSPRPSARGSPRSLDLHVAQTHQHFAANFGWLARLIDAQQQSPAHSEARKLLTTCTDSVQRRAYADTLHQHSGFFILPSAALTAPAKQTAARQQGRTPTLLGRWKILDIQLRVSHADKTNCCEFNQAALHSPACAEVGGLCGNLLDQVGHTVTKRAKNGSENLFSDAAERRRRSHAAQVNPSGPEATRVPKFQDRGLSKKSLASSQCAKHKENSLFEAERKSVVPTSSEDTGAAKPKLSLAAFQQDNRIEWSAPREGTGNLVQGQSQVDLGAVGALTHSRGGAATVEEIEAGHAHARSTDAPQFEIGRARRYDKSEAESHRQTSTIVRLLSAEQDPVASSEAVLSSRPSTARPPPRPSQNTKVVLPYENDLERPQLNGGAESPLQPPRQRSADMTWSASPFSGSGVHADEEYKPVAEAVKRVHRGSGEGDSRETRSEKLELEASTGDVGSGHDLAKLEPQKNTANPSDVDPKAKVRQMETKEGGDSVSPFLPFENRLYRAEDNPKTYGASATSSLGTSNRERTNGTGVSPGMQNQERWHSQNAKSKPGGAAQDDPPRREPVAEAELFDVVDWTDPEAVARVESVLSHQLHALEWQASTVEEQLKGIQADMQAYRAGIEGFDPEHNADTFEQLVHGGKSSTQQLLLEKLQTASASLDNRVKTYVRTNTTFYAHQLNDIVQVRLAPLRQGVLDLSLNLMDAASITIDITRKLNEAASQVKATATREADQMQALRRRKEVAFTEALEEEEVKLQAHLVASKQKEQRRVNKSSVEEQILLSAIEGAVDDLRKRGFAVLDFSAVYPESEARKVLELTLHFTDLQTRPLGWEVLPIVVVPSSGFVGHIDIPQTVSEWLTGVLAATYGHPPSASLDPTATAQFGETVADVVHKAESAKGTGSTRSVRKDKHTFTPQDRSRRDFNEASKGHILRAGSADVGQAAPKGGGERSTPQMQHSIGTPYTTGSRVRSLLLSRVLDWRIPRRISTSDDSALGPVRAGSSRRSTTTAARGHLVQGKPLAERSIEAQPVVSTVVRPNAAAVNLDGEAEQDFAFSCGRHHGTAGLQQSGFKATAPKDSSEALLAGKQLPAEGLGIDVSNDFSLLGRCGESPQQTGQREPRRLSLLENVWRERCSRAFEQHIHRRLSRTKNIGPQSRNVQSGETQLFSATQLILGESHPDEDEAEAERKWRAVVLRKARAVVASYWGKVGQLPGQAPESRWARSILPPLYTLQHLVHEHFKNSPVKSKGRDVSQSGNDSHIAGAESTRHDNAGAGISRGVDAYCLDGSTGAFPVACSPPAIAHDQTRKTVEHAPVFGNQIGYYVLRAEQILVEGFYVAPGGEVNSVLLRYPPLKDLGPLVHSSEYGVQLLRHLATSLPTKSKLKKRSSPGDAAKSTPQSAQGDKHRGMHGAAGKLATGVEQAPPRAVQAGLSRGARYGSSITAKEEGETKGVPHCAPANYNPFLRCLTGHRPPVILRHHPSSTTASKSMEGAAKLSPDRVGPREAAQDTRSSDILEGNAGTVGDGAQHLQKPTGLGKCLDSQTADGAGLTAEEDPEGRMFTETSRHLKSAGGKVFTSDAGAVEKLARTLHIAAPQNEAAVIHTGSTALHKDHKDPPSGSLTEQMPARNYERNAESPSSSTRTASPSQAERTLSDTGVEDAKLWLTRKVLIIHLGPRHDGLPLAYPDGTGGKELQRQRLVRCSLTELLASSNSTNVPVDDCGSCTARSDGSPKQQRTAGSTTRTVPEERANSPEKSVSKGDAGSGNTEGDADCQRGTEPKWPCRFGPLDAVGAKHVNAVTLAKTLKNAQVESGIRRQLLALEQELRLATPIRWVVDGALIEKQLEIYQVELSVGWGRPPPPLHLPVTPFFMRNILLIRVEVEKCPKKFGGNSYSVPPNSVLQQALYLLAHPVAGHAAVAAFHYGRTSEASLLERLRSARKPLDVTASDIALHAASFWGRATGASMETFWIAHVHVSAPGKPTGSTIELLDGRLTAEPDSLMPLSDTAGKQVLFPSEVQTWGWRYAELLEPNEGPFLKGRVASYGESATDCKPVETLVGSTAANLQTRIIPQGFVSGLRGRSVIVALSGTDTPFKGEQLVSQADLEAEWHAETSRQKQK